MRQGVLQDKEKSRWGIHVSAERIITHAHTHTATHTHAHTGTHTLLRAQCDIRAQRVFPGCKVEQHTTHTNSRT